MSGETILFFLAAAVVLLAALAVYQQLAFRRGTQAQLRSISGRLREIVETDSGEELMLFTANKELMELAAQINAAVDSTYDPENRNYLLQTAGSGLTVDLSSEDASAPLGGPVVCGSWFQYDLGQQPTVTALLYPQDMPMTAVAAYASHVNYEDGLLELNTATGTLMPDGDYLLTLHPPEAPATPISDPEAIPLADLPWPSREQSGYFQPDYSIWADGPVKMLGFSDDRTAAVFCFDELLTSQSGLLLCVGGLLPGVDLPGQRLRIAGQPGVGGF